MKKIITALSFVFMFTALHASWDMLKTDQFSIFYEPAYKAKAIRILSDLEYYKTIPEGIVGNKCDNMVLVLDDYGQYVNGFANPVYYNIHFINYETEDTDWFSFVTVHEYTHMVQMTKAGGAPGVLAAIFGNLLSPMVFAPQWTFEAITVYDESKISKYMGRLNDGAFDSYMKICSRADQFPSLMKATYLPLEFPYGNGEYIFGSEFLNFLAITYGEDKLKKFYDSYSTSLGSYLSPIFPWAGIDRTFDEVFGGTTMSLWDKWKEYEKTIAKDYKQEGEQITFQGDNASWPAVKCDRLYYVRNTVEKTGPFEAKSYNKIMEIDLKSGTSNVIACTTSSYTHPFRFSGNKMYYAVSEIKPGYANKSNLSYGTFSVIYERNLDTKEEHVVLADDIRAFFVPYEGRLIYAKDDPYKTGSELYEYNLETGENKLLFDSDYLVLALTGNAETMIAEAKVGGENSALYSVDKAKKSFTAIVNTPFFEDEPELYGDRLFFRANYGKTYSAYCYDLKSKKVSRLTENGSAGTPAYYEPANEIYFSAGAVNGFDLYKKKAEFKPYGLPKDKPDFVLPKVIDEATLKKGGYLDNLATLFPRVRLPAYFDGANLFAGFMLNGQDSIGDFNYTLGGIYDIAGKKLDYSMSVAAYVFSPAILYMSSNNVDDRGRAMMNVGINVPLYRSIREGISGISVWVNHMFFEGFSRRQLAPGVGVSFRWPCFETDMSVSRAFEGAWLGSPKGMNRQGTMANISLRKFVPEGKIELRGLGIYDPDNSDNVVPGIRGYDDNVNGNTGSEWTLEFTKPVWKIRAGLWNPVNFYIEDLCVKAFIDTAFANNTQFSYGLELHLETKWFNLVPGDLGIRVSMNRENRFDWGPVVNIMGMGF